MKRHNILILRLPLLLMGMYGRHIPFSKWAFAARRKWQNPRVILRRIGIKRGMRVADLGCGPGFFTLPMASLVGEKGLVYAVDSDMDALKRLNGSHASKARIRIVHADVSKTRIQNSSIDVAFFANVLHDIGSKAAFLREIRRICKPDAIAVDIDWKKASTELGPPRRVRLSEHETRRILSKNGFKVVRRLDAGPNHYGLVCRPL